MKKKVKETRIAGLFIDPYRRELVYGHIGPQITLWHRLLACDCMSASLIAGPQHFTRKIGDTTPAGLDLWYDDEFFRRNDLAPSFRVFSPDDGQEYRICGYGWLTCSNTNGESDSLFLERDQIPCFAHWLRLGWECWEIDGLHEGKEYIEQRMRSIELDSGFKELCRIEVEVIGDE